MTTPLTPVQRERLARRRRRLREPALYLRLGLLVAFLAAPLAPLFSIVDLILKIALFAALVASYDIVIGYTGVVSFGHAMFFGFGAYAVALALGGPGGPTYTRLAGGFVTGIAVSAVLAVVVGAFSLRVRAIFFAMITLAFAEFALILAVQWSQLTGGEDGLSPRLPGVFAVSWDGGRLAGLALTGRVATYYFVIAVCAAAFLAMSRFVHSPLGRTLQAIRDNELRAEALGYQTFGAQIVSSSFASVVATVLGGCYAMWVRYVNPESVLGIPIMLDILLMVTIGGIGSLYGGVVGAAFLLSARTLLPDLKAWSARLWPGSELAERLSERWLLYFGLLFILVVFFFPRGVLGTVQERLAARRLERGEPGPGE